MTVTFENGEYVATCAVGRVRFKPIGYRQVEMILEFSKGAGKPALDCCRDALAYIFSNTDTLIVRGWVSKTNAAARAFGTAFGATDVKESDEIVERRLTKTRWEKYYADH